MRRANAGRHRRAASHRCVQHRRRRGRRCPNDRRQTRAHAGKMALPTAGMRMTTTRSAPVAARIFAGAAWVPAVRRTRRWTTAASVSGHGSTPGDTKQTRRTKTRQRPRMERQIVARPIWSAARATGRRSTRRRVGRWAKREATVSSTMPVSRRRRTVERGRPLFWRWAMARPARPTRVDPLRQTVRIGQGSFLSGCSTEKGGENKSRSEEGRVNETISH